MRNILIVYLEMMVGGSTTSLLSILNNIDYTEYNVDLLLYENKGDLYENIPCQVNILPQANQNKNKIDKVLKGIKSPQYILNYFKSRIYGYKYGNIVKSQIMCYENARFSRKINKKYDVAISFLEGWSCDYVANYVDADKKISWIHVDYRACGFLPRFDEECFRKLDNIVLVSEACARNFKEIFPQYSNKILTIENIISSNTIVKLSSNYLEDKFVVDRDSLKLCSVCRIYFSHKGLDRGVRALAKLNQENLLENVKWYIIGDGPDTELLIELINQYKLQEKIVLLGKKINPFPYVKNMDIFFLPSIYEGKPMAVTESQILGLVPVVTEYLSANEQINHKVDGIIMGNSEEEIYNWLKYLIMNQKLIKELRNNILNRNYSNNEEFKKIIHLIKD